MVRPLPESTTLSLGPINGEPVDMSELSPSMFGCNLLAISLTCFWLPARVLSRGWRSDGKSGFGVKVSVLLVISWLASTTSHCACTSLPLGVYALVWARLSSMTRAFGSTALESTCLLGSLAASRSILFFAGTDVGSFAMACAKLWYSGLDWSAICMRSLMAFCQALWVGALACSKAAAAGLAPLSTAMAAAALRPPLFGSSPMRSEGLRLSIESRSPKPRASLGTGVLSCISPRSRLARRSALAARSCCSAVLLSTLVRAVPSGVTSKSLRGAVRRGSPPNWS